MENPFVKLFAIDFKDHLEVKKSGNTELKYVSWAYAWAEVKKLYPSASYEVKKFNGLPYVYDPITGFMVYTSVTIEGVSHEMWLPVLDGANKAMKAVPYTYTTPKWDYNPQTRRREKVGMEERTVEAASIPLYSLNVILASQSIREFNASERTMLCQANHKLFFHPALLEVKYYAELLSSPQHRAEISDLLRNLEVGQCVFQGPIYIGEEAKPTCAPICVNVSHLEDIASASLSKSST